MHYELSSMLCMVKLGGRCRRGGEGGCTPGYRVECVPLISEVAGDVVRCFY